MLDRALTYLSVQEVMDLHAKQIPFEVSGDLTLLHQRNQYAWDHWHTRGRIAVMMYAARALTRKRGTFTANELEARLPPKYFSTIQQGLRPMVDRGNITLYRNGQYRVTR